MYCAMIIPPAGDKLPDNDKLADPISPIIDNPTKMCGSKF